MEPSVDNARCRAISSNVTRTNRNATYSTPITIFELESFGIGSLTIGRSRTRKRSEGYRKFPKSHEFGHGESWNYCQSFGLSNSMAASDMAGTLVLRASSTSG